MALAGFVPTDPLDQIVPQLATGGMGATVGNDYLILPYSSRIAFDLIRENARSLAAIVVDTMPAFKSPYPDVCKKFVRDLHAIATELAIPLIFDEVVCGFRLGLGGAREWLGLSP